VAKVPQVELPFSAETAFAKVLKACEEVGKVEEASELAKFIVVKAKYGLNPVRARISVVSNGTESSIIEFVARGQDVWGVASKTVVDRIIAAIR
jgi:hypothetical protein